MQSIFMGTYRDENKGQRPFPPTHSHFAVIKTLFITAVFQNPTWVPQSMHYRSYILLRYGGIRGRINGTLKLLKENSSVIKDCLKCDREILRNDIAVGHFGI